ncbi:rtt106-domain-containing protein [Colletotrichum incanum]|uniref:Rtt106-domain-containing protein n=1 Tax=Colletotrichum incanum TaxID=1573173 RepID=A0A166T9C7_COLIC|nr:rtt106-domain-containing protein [Colletotrichum incanum]
MPRGGKSARGRGGKVASQPTKRKRDASDAGTLDGIQKRRTDNEKSREEGREWNHQYYQGVKSTELHGMGCGSCRLGTPRVPFQAPFTCDGRLEFMSGTEGKGSGSIRLCGPKDYWGISDLGVSDAIFLIPFKHIEQVIILPTAAKPTRSNVMYEVVIVPTAATGASSVRRQYPQIISFTWPGKAADDGLSGEVGNKADPASDTYLSILKKVINEQLEASEKSVIDVSEKAKDDLINGMESILSPPMGSTVKSKTNGNLHFLATGVLFNSESLRIYLPFNSLSKVMLVQAHDLKGAKSGNGKIVAFDLLCSSTEPFYSGEGEGKEEETLISFQRLDVTLFDGVREYMKEHDITVMLCEQTFYDYKGDKPMTGFMPMSTN